MWVTLVVALTLLLSSPLLSGAYVDPPTALPPSLSVHHNSPVTAPWLLHTHPTWSMLLGAPLTLVLLVLVAIALACSPARLRKATALGLSLVLAVFTFGIAFHAVHHLSEPEKAAACPVFTASQHVTGTPADTCDLHVPALAGAQLLSGRFDAPPLAPAFHRGQPRAPPSFAA